MSEEVIKTAPVVPGGELELVAEIKTEPEIQIPLEVSIIRLISRIFLNLLRLYYLSLCQKCKSTWYLLL